MGEKVLFAAVSEYGGLSNKIVNLKPKEYWVGLFEKNGMKRREDLEEQIRKGIGELRRNPIIKMVIDNLICMEKK